MTKKKRTPNELEKKARKGFRGYPIATIAYYGPNDKFATKVAVGIVLGEGEEPMFLERWFTEKVDVRVSRTINLEIINFIEKHNVKSVAMVDRIIGCPYEEGVNYPAGESCPECIFWRGRDRWTGEIIH